jgi:hypothetical protein
MSIFWMQRSATRLRPTTRRSQGTSVLNRLTGFQGRTKAGQNEGCSGRVEQGERGMGGAPCNDLPGPGGSKDTEDSTGVRLVSLRFLG